MNMSVRQRTAIRRSTSHPAEGRRMQLVRHLVPALVAGLFWAVPLGAQETTGAVAGKVVDATTQQPLGNVEVALAGTPHRELTRADGSFVLNGVPAGPYRLRATRIGYGSQFQEIAVTAGGTTTAQVSLAPAAAILEPVVVTGYGTQRREAITGSVSTVNADAANVGVKTNVDQLIQGRAAGVDIDQNNGEPGAGRQVLIRGGSSIGVGGATNDPLYVVDGVPINNVATEPQAMGVFGDPMLARNPLNVLNPSDISSITVLKDAAATAIYGSRASNGVILIETKRGQASVGPTFEYDGYVATSSPAKYLDLLSSAEYVQYVRQQVAAGKLDPVSLTGLGILVKTGPNPGDTTRVISNTDWDRAITRTSVTHNHNLAFSGGSEATRYRASMNYAKEEGVTLSTGLERIQGRLSATHSDLNNRLRVGVNVMTSRVNNSYLTYENQGGFTGGVFQNVAVYNPTLPITVTDSLGTHYYDPVGTVHNPVAMANQLIDIGHSTRTLANASADLDVAPGLTARVNVGLDHSSGDRQEYYPNASPIGVSLGNGLAQQQNLDNSTQTLQTLLTYQRQVGEGTSLDVVGGYEYSKFKTNWVQAEGIGFFSDAYGFNNLSAATTRNANDSATESRLASFFGRANVGFKDRYFVTGVLRYDGSSKFAVGHKWGLFPALSASWLLSKEAFLAGGPSTDLTTGPVSGQGQSGVNAERLFPGSPLGTFFGPVFLGVDGTGKQVFFCTPAKTPSCGADSTTTTGLAPNQADYREIGNANPDFTLGFHNQVTWGKLDVSFLVRASVGGQVFNNTALVYSAKVNASHGQNFLRPALTDPTGINEQAIYSSRWIESGTFVRLQNITVEYDLDLPLLTRSARSARVYVSADNLLLLTGYSGLDPEVFSGTGTAVRGIDYLTYPRPRTITGGLRLMF